MGHGCDWRFICCSRNVYKSVGRFEHGYECWVGGDERCLLCCKFINESDRYCDSVNSLSLSIIINSLYIPGIASSSFGKQTIASGDYANAFGERSEARGRSSMVSGERNRANGRASVASGLLSLAQGAGSFAQGLLAQSYGSGGFASGIMARSFG